MPERRIGSHGDLRHTPAADVDSDLKEHVKHKITHGVESTAHTTTTETPLPTSDGTLTLILEELRKMNIYLSILSDHEV